MHNTHRGDFPLQTFIVLIAVVGGIGLIGLYVWFQAVYTVGNTQQVLVLRYGEVMAVRDEPGQYYKAPMIDQVVYYTKQPVKINAPTVALFDEDENELLVNASLTYQITDPVQFRRTLQNEMNARSRLADIALSILRDKLESSSRSEVLRDPGVADGNPVDIPLDIPVDINEKVIEPARKAVEQRVRDVQFGIEIVDLSATATYRAN